MPALTFSANSGISMSIRHSQPKAGCTLRPLDEIIAARKAKAIEYEEYLRRIAELARKVAAGTAEDTPAALNTPGKRALYNNLKHSEEVALRIDETVKRVRPDGWRGFGPKENVIKKALFDILNDAGEVERIFLIVKAQSEY